MEFLVFKSCFKGGLYFTVSNVLAFFEDLVKYHSTLHLPLCLQAIITVTQIITSIVASTVNAMMPHKGNSYGYTSFIAFNS